MIGCIGLSKQQSALGPRQSSKTRNAGCLSSHHPRSLAQLVASTTRSNANMSTQYSSDIPFSASHRQQALKLLELPPELLSAIESPNPPTFVCPLTVWMYTHLQLTFCQIHNNLIRIHLHNARTRTPLLRRQEIPNAAEEHLEPHHGPESLCNSSNRSR